MAELNEPAAPDIREVVRERYAAAALGGTDDTGAKGRDGKVTCKLFGKKSVKCTVSYSNARRSSARLVKGKRTVARGTVSSKGKLTLTAKTRLSRGTYSLVAGGHTVKLKLG